MHIQKRSGPGCMQAAQINRTGLSQSLEALHRENADLKTGRQHSPAWGKGLLQHLDMEQGRIQVQQC